ASPYINQAIKQLTEDYPSLNIPAHIIWGAIEAELGGGSATTGAIAAGVGELAAPILSVALFGESDPSKLSETEKQQILNLSKLAAGVASGLTATGNSAENLATISQGMKVAENAVENNTFGLLEHPSTAAEIQKQMFEKMSAEEKQEYYKNIEKLDSIVDNLTDFLPVYGDVKSFQEAEEAIDYALAAFGVIPGADIVTKFLKEAKIAYQAARNAETIGEAKEQLDVANDLIIKGKQKYDQIWSETKFTKPVPNAYQHWDKHKSEFPNLNNAKEYVDMAHDFMRNPPEDTLVKTRKNGDTIFYSPKSGIFAVKNKENIPKTMFKPDPKKHGYKTNEDYFNAQ
ncbi:VENN motif pre-toxin domain-containing protein, partial [Ursidibacter sp. B-7004-1]